MKKLITSVILCAITGFAATAAPKGDNPQQELRKIISLDASKNDVIKTLGEPDKILAKKGQTSWWYGRDGVEISINWDETSNHITYMRYESRKKRAKEWSSADQSDLDIEKTTFNQVLDNMGIPDGVIVNNKKEKSIRYKFENYTLNMRFLNGILSSYEINKNKA